MNVAHICKKFSAPSETFIYHLILRLEAAGTRNHVLTGRRLNAGERPFGKVSCIPDPLPARLLFGLKKKVFHIYDYRLPLDRYLRRLAEIQPDILVAHFGGTGLAAWPLAHALNVPLVVTFHAFDMFTRGFRPHIYRALWPHVERVVPISAHGRDVLVSRFGCPPERVTVIPCGIDLGRFQPQRAPRTGTAVRMVTLGRLVEKKGTELLIRALARTRDTFPDIRLDVYGDGPLQGRLVRLTARLGLTGTVRFHGAADHRDVPNHLAASDIFALPSLTARNGDREGIPVTILEAQAAGLPVLSTLHSGIPEAIPDENQLYLARENDIEDLTKKLCLLIAARAQWPAIAERGRAFVARHFSAETETRMHLRLLEETAHAARAHRTGAPGNGTERSA